VDNNGKMALIEYLCVLLGVLLQPIDLPPPHSPPPHHVTSRKTRAHPMGSLAPTAHTSSKRRWRPY
jgi:hypothetical protein